MTAKSSDKNSRTPEAVACDDLLCDFGLVFRRTSLGEPVFCKTEAESAGRGDAISFQEWDPDQLEAIARAMRAYPELRLFPDGSGA